LDPLIKSPTPRVEMVAVFSQRGPKPASMHQRVMVGFPTVEALEKDAKVASQVRHNRPVARAHTSLRTAWTAAEKATRVWLNPL